MILNDKLKNKIEAQTGEIILAASSLSGGCISDAYKLDLKSGGSFFLKLNFNASDDMFLKEAHGLLEIQKAEAIRVPKVILYDSSFILTEFMGTGKKSKMFDEDFGRKFALMHKFSRDEFGFYENNYIGSTAQINLSEGIEKTDWVKFYFNKRILFQYKLAEKNGYSTPELGSGVSSLENKIEQILEGSKEKPSLLHGDLWGGNYMVDVNGDACLIDPAVYYGHREADLAMTKLFGGFNSRFYGSYNECFPLPGGYEYRENIYKLYHILNHLNLFGSGYYSQAISLMNYYR